MLTRFLLLIFYFIQLDFSGISQNEKRYIKIYKEGNSFFSIGEFEKAIDFYKKSIKLNPNYCNSYFKLGISYKNLENYSLYKNTFKNLREKDCLSFSDRINYELGEIYFYEGNSKLSLKFFKSINDTLKFLDLNSYLQNLNYEISYNNKKPIEVIRKDTLSTYVHQYSPFYDKFNQRLYYTSRKGIRLNDDEDIRYTSVQDFTFDSNQISYEKINTLDNEGTVSLSDDRKLLVFTSCEMNFKRNTCDLYFIQKNKNGTWSKVQKMDESVNSNYWDSQPYIYNNILIFVSNRPGGLGGRDLWYSELIDGKWNKAKNLKDINSKYDEISPTFYKGFLLFSSNRTNSFGGYDIFYSKYNSIGSQINNLGPSINNYNDQTSINISDKIFFLTEEYRFNKRTKSNIISGKVDKDNISLIKYIVVSIKDSESNNIVDSDLKMIQGTNEKKIYPSFMKTYLINRPIPDSIKFLAQSNGYFPEIINGPFEDSVVVLLNKIKKQYVLENIYFELDSYELSTDSKNVLDIIILWLSKNDNIKIEIGGHTDDIGDDNYNLILSEKRANSVFKYLLEKNKNLKNLSFKGYGNRVPISSGYNGPKNRRIEFRILE